VGCETRVRVRGSADLGYADGTAGEGCEDEAGGEVAGAVKFERCGGLCGRHYAGRDGERESRSLDVVVVILTAEILGWPASVSEIFYFQVRSFDAV
jgi:hypothetical protein